jgi:hypothetical protein
LAVGHHPTVVDGAPKPARGSPYTASMLDAGLRVTLRHFWTLFFLAAAVTVPFHLIYVFVWHGVVGLRELVPQIEHLPPAQRVHFVGAAEVRHAHIGLWVLDLAELVLLPLALRAARAVMAADERGELPTVVRAWRAVFGRQQTRRPPLSIWFAAALTGVAVGLLGDGIARLLAAPWGPSWSYVILGLAQGSARAAGAAFFLGPVAYAAQAHSSSEVVRGALR